MLRLKKSTLKEEKGRFFYKEGLFSGIAFAMSDGEMVNAIKISEVPQGLVEPDLYGVDKASRISGRCDDARCCTK